jgi:hypothetical protein
MKVSDNTLRVPSHLLLTECLDSAKMPAKKFKADGAAVAPVERRSGKLGLYKVSTHLSHGQKGFGGQDGRYAMGGQVESMPYIRNGQRIFLRY